MSHFKQLSFWAKGHKWTSRFIITFSFIIITALGIITGSLFNDLNIIFPGFALFLPAAIFILTWLRYPRKKITHKIIEKKRFYVFQKACDSILVATTFLMIVYFGNHQTSPLNYFVLNTSALNSFSLPNDSSKTYKSIDEFRKMLKDENGKPLKWKERKKLLKDQIRNIKKDKTTSDGEKVLLIILCVLLAFVLAYGVAALSCSLSCSGSEGAAVVVAILGLAGIVVLTFFLIRSIVRRSKKEKSKQEKTEGSSSGY